MTTSPPSIYPTHYRQAEIAVLTQATQAGDSALVAGLSGSGKSNLLRCLAERPSGAHPHLLVDLNALGEAGPAGLITALAASLNSEAQTWDDLRQGIGRYLDGPGRDTLTFMIDRFEVLPATIAGPLRALRDGFKYRLGYMIGMRRPIAPHNELAELFYGCTLWLGPLSDADAEWTITRFCARRGLTWGRDTRARLRAYTGQYPSFLRAACEAYAAGTALEPLALAAHPAVQGRLREFWGDQPSEDELRACHLLPPPLIAARPTATPVTAGSAEPTDASLTAKEAALLAFLRARPGQVCTKDELARAVWPEDRVFGDGVRDDALAQLVRRLREKIEPAPSKPIHLLTVPGRGYRYVS
jgi:hypothetical protein